MKVFRSKDIALTPTSHENKDHPGVLKRVLIQYNDIMKGHIQMINWAYMNPGESFNSHYHEDMEEIFIILEGEANFIIEAENKLLSKGDVVIVPIKMAHKMENVGDCVVEFICIGVCQGLRGKTVVV